MVVPGGPMIESLHGIPFEPWAAPGETAGWGALGNALGGGAPECVDRPGDDPGGRFGAHISEEPQFVPTAGLAPAAGVVILEPDDRVWAVAPTNGFGGYSLTFPKGRLEAGLDLRASARKEAHEEVGLRVAIRGFLIDLPRSTTYTRFYLARRIGGTPAAMGWESQAAWLVPRARLREVIVHPNDRPVLDALDTRCPELR